MAKKTPKYVVKADNFNGLNLYVPEDAKDRLDTAEAREQYQGSPHDKLSESVVNKVTKLKLE